MDLSRKYAIDKDRITYRIIDGEAVILNLDSGYYYSLNSVGTNIWKMIDEGKKPETILSCLEQDYRQVEKRDLKKDMVALLDDLKKEKLIEEIGAMI